MSSNYFSDFAYFSDGQYIALFVVGILSCLLSIIGSGIILYLVIVGGRLGELYHRLLVGLSVSDLLMTSTLILQPILVRHETGYKFAIGNRSSCAFLGFGYLFFIASYAYNCLLGIYFLAVVRYRVSEKTISRYMEPWGHVIAFLMPIAIGVSSAMNDLLNVNPFLGTCALFPTNHECTWKDEISCKNDKASQVLNNMLDFYALGLVFVGLVCTIIVYRTMRAQIKVTQNVSEHLSNDMIDAQHRRIHSVSIQAVCYSAAYLVGLIVVMAANVVYSIYLEDSLASLGESTVYFVVILLIWMFFPLQGFLNCLIYIRPRLVRWKHHYGDSSWWFAFKQVLTGKPPPRWGEPTTTTSEGRNTNHTSNKRSPNGNNISNNHSSELHENNISMMTEDAETIPAVKTDTPYPSVQARATARSSGTDSRGRTISSDLWSSVFSDQSHVDDVCDNTGTQEYTWKSSINTTTEHEDADAKSESEVINA